MKVVSPKDKYKDDNIYYDIVNYCLNSEKAIHNYVVERNMSEDSLSGAMYEMASQFDKLRGTRIRHTILSFDPESEKRISPFDAYCIADAVCDYYEDSYQIFAVVHENKENLHIHVVMNTVSIKNGKKYTGRKKDYYDFQNYLKSILKKYYIKLKIKK